MASSGVNVSAYPTYRTPSPALISSPGSPILRPWLRRCLRYMASVNFNRKGKTQPNPARIPASVEFDGEGQEGVREESVTRG